MSVITLLTQSSEQKRLPRVTRVYVCKSPETRHIRAIERACDPLRHFPHTPASVFMCCRAAVCDYACLMFACCWKCHGCFTATSVIGFAGSGEGGRDDRKVRPLNPSWFSLASAAAAAQLCAWTAWRRVEGPAPPLGKLLYEWKYGHAAV